MGDIDAKLIGYLHSVPPDAQEDLIAAIKLASSAQRKGSWVRAILIAACALFGSGYSANVYLSRLVTRDYIDAIEAARRVRDDDRARLEESQNNRLTAVETQSGNNKDCCSTQSRRLDTLLTPGRLTP